MLAVKMLLESVQGLFAVGQQHKSIVNIPDSYLGGQWEGVQSTLSIYRLATTGESGEPITAPSTCSKNSSWTSCITLEVA